MSGLIPTMTITEFHKLHVPEIKRMKSVELTSDGEHLLTVIIPRGDPITRDFIYLTAEALAQKSNITEGVAPEEVVHAAV